MWRHFAKLAVLIAAVIILTSCATPAPVVEQSREARVGDLVGEGHSVEVSNCVAGMADGIGSGDSTNELIDACTRAEEMLNAPEEVPEEIAFAGPSGYGDDPELDRLWDACAAADGPACDQLWELAPIDTEYERFGVTCGERVDILNCSDLRPEPEDQPETE